jgi:2-polyprenyl-3-methyl-5-hydroxy-6-metoxy-1,4-benzoquinol methylase
MSLNVVDDRGYHQGFDLKNSSVIRMKRRAWFMVNQMNIDTKGLVLEIGCGRGEISFWIAEATQHKVIGSDLCVPFIEEARTNYNLPNLRYEVLDFNRTDHINNMKFDYIVGNGILHHLYENLDRTLSTLHFLLKPGGKIIFIEPNIYNPYCAAIFNVKVLRKAARLEPGEMAFSALYIQKKLNSAGFHMVNASYRDFLLPGVPLFCVKPLIVIGNIVERIPVLNRLAQSIYITASSC